MATCIKSDLQVVPDEVFRRDEVISIDAFTQSGVLQVIRIAREQEASSVWVAREVPAKCARGLADSSGSVGYAASLPY